MLPWRAEEDAVLVEMYEGSEPRQAIAIRLGRTVDAVDARRRILRHDAARTQPRPWQPREDELLRAARAAGIPATEVAPRLGRSVESVRSRGKQLGLGHRPARLYTSEEDETLRMDWGRGETVDELARKLGRSPDAVRLRARHLCISTTQRRQRWSADDDRRLREGYADGLTCRSINAALLPERTAGAIAARAALLGLALHGRRWTENETMTLATLTIAGCSVEQIARRLERSAAAIRQRTRRIGLRRPIGAPNRNGGKRWSAADDAILCGMAAADLVLLSQRLGRSEEAIRRRSATLGLREGRARSPHRAPPRTPTLTVAERRIGKRAVDAGGNTLLSVSRRLGIAPGALRRETREASLSAPEARVRAAGRPLLSLARLANAPTRQPENVSPHQLRD